MLPLPERHLVKYFLTCGKDNEMMGESSLSRCAGLRVGITIRLRSSVCGKRFKSLCWFNGLMVEGWRRFTLEKLGLWKDFFENKKGKDDYAFIKIFLKSGMILWAIVVICSHLIKSRFCSSVLIHNYIFTSSWNIF